MTAPDAEAMRQALEFYATETNWETHYSGHDGCGLPWRPVSQDEGRRARAALALNGGDQVVEPNKVIGRSEGKSLNDFTLMHISRENLKPYSALKRTRAALSLPREDGETQLGDGQNAEMKPKQDIQDTRKRTAREGYTALDSRAGNAAPIPPPTPTSELAKRQRKTAAQFDCSGGFWKDVAEAADALDAALAAEEDNMTGPQ